MMRPLSNGLRERVIGVVEGGLSRRAAAERFGIAVATAVRWVRSWRESGSAAPRRLGGDLSPSNWSIECENFPVRFGVMRGCALLQLEALARARRQVPAPVRDYRFTSPISFSFRMMSSSIPGTAT